MIVVDTSAIIAMMLKEPGYKALVTRMFADTERVISPTVLLEATIVLSHSHPAPEALLASYLRSANIVCRDIDSAQAEAAQNAFLTFGKGRHPARLNFGDCFSYAAAKALNAPLLFIGNDFAQTDIRAA